MKKLLVALGFALAATGASANIVSNGLTVTGNSPVAIVNSTTDGSDALWGGDGSTLTAGLYSSGNSGTLIANASGWFEATYLGQVASFPNKYNGNGLVMNGVNSGGAVGTIAGQAVTAGSTIPFAFLDGGNFSTFSNGQANTAIQGMAFLDASIWNAFHGTAYDFLIGYNDSAPVNADYDDYVIGVVNHVPVPAALPLMASALGLFGVARRKNKAKVA
jgi:hypothetical protein